MSVSADHYEKATVNGHPGALGNAQSSEHRNAVFDYLAIKVLLDIHNGTISLYIIT